MHLTLQKLKTASLTFQISRGYLIQQKLKRALHITKSQGHLTLQKLKRKPHITKSQEGTSHDKILSYGTVIVNFQEMVMKTRGSVG